MAAKPMGVCIGASCLAPIQPTHCHLRYYINLAAKCRTGTQPPAAISFTAVSLMLVGSAAAPFAKKKMAFK